MPWDRESDEEYDDGYTRESFERADEDQPEDLDEPITSNACADREAADWFAWRTQGPA